MATISFTQIAAVVVQNHTALYGLATNGEVYEYSAAGEGWVPLSMVVLRPPAASAPAA